jgi:spore maturation protein CgeB
MRILAVRPGPAFSVQDVHDGWVYGLRAAGAEVVDYNHDARIEFYARAAHEKPDGTFQLALDPQRAVSMALNSLHAVCYQYRPDVVLCTSGFYLVAGYLDVIRAHGSKVVILHTESPYEDDAQVKRAAHADLNIINDPTNLDGFRATGRTYYLPHAYRPDRHYPRTTWAPEAASDVCFVGTAYPSRIAFLNAVDWTGIDLALAGNWQWLAPESPLRKHVAHDIEQCCDNEQTAELYAATQLAFNLYRREANAPELVQGWAMGPREVELAAMGVFFLRESRGESDALLPMLPTFDGPDEFGSLMREWLPRDKQRGQCAELARAAIANRNFVFHARQLLAWLDV